MLRFFSLAFPCLAQKSLRLTHSSRGRGTRSLSILAVAGSLFAAAGVTSSCKDSSQEASSGAQAPAANSPEALVARGKSVYLGVCIACHNSDPKKAGSLGPDVWGSSLELLTARVMTATYPKGYTPKRTTHAMAPLPSMQKDLPALHAYLNAK